MGQKKVDDELITEDEWLSGSQSNKQTIIGTGEIN